jgi:hypothetical protein
MLRWRLPDRLSLPLLRLLVAVLLIPPRPVALESFESALTAVCGAWGSGEGACAGGVGRLEGFVALLNHQGELRNEMRRDEGQKERRGGEPT